VSASFATRKATSSLTSPKSLSYARLHERAEKGCRRAAEDGKRKEE
jgi:hypothetical protein